MFEKKVEKAKSDWPIDKVNLKKVHVDILGQYPAPNHENKVFGFTLLLTLLAAPFLLFFALGLGVVACVAFWSMFKRRLNIRITPEVIRINGKRYALEGIKEFRVEPHERAYKPDPGVYARALEVVMQYGEKRVVIAEMRQKEKDKAVALGLRLQDWIEKFEEMIANVRQSAQQEAEPAKGDFGPSPDIR